MRAGLTVGALGLALLLTAFGLEVHAVRATQVTSGESFTINSRPVHVTGVVDPGTDARASARCTVASAGGTRMVTVGTRLERLAGIRVGTSVRARDGGSATVTCDRRVAVATGPLVRAYPLAGSALLYVAYALVTVLGLGYARRWRRTRPEDDIGGGRELKGFTLDIALELTRGVAAVAAVLLGLVLLVVLRDGTPAGLVLLPPVVLLALLAVLAARWQRRRRAARGSHPAT